MSYRSDRELLESAAFVTASYLYGSIPFIHVLARRNGVNLREVGSRTVGGSNLWQQVGPALGAIGWLLDASKGALPPLVGRRLGLGRAARAAGASAGVAGQCWPLFLGFDGGRGVSAILGAAAALAPRESAVMLAVISGGCSLRAGPLLKRSTGASTWDRLLLQGKNSKVVPLSVGFGILGVPLLAALRKRPPEAIAGTVVNAALLFLRRATAVDNEPKRGETRTQTTINKLLYDRGTSE